MSDLYGTDDRSSFEPDSEPGQESEDMTFFYNLLHSSPAPGSGSGAGSRSAAHHFRGSAAMINSSGGPGLHFTDLEGGAFGRDKVEQTFDFAAVGDCDGVTSSMKIREFSLANKGSDGSDTAGNRSSKRSRSAEVHNLSEKRRRSKINEKLKALQNLIPNSNKTDKASMLDEAIEYLKQLQLQVQMLTMRNGITLHPHYVAPPVQLPLEFNPENAPNTSREADASVPGFTNPRESRESSQQHSVPPMTDSSNAGFQFGLEPSPTQNNYVIFNHMTATKVPRV